MTASVRVGYFRVKGASVPPANSKPTQSGQPLGRQVDGAVLWTGAQTGLDIVVLCRSPVWLRADGLVLICRPHSVMLECQG